MVNKINDLQRSVSGLVELQRARSAEPDRLLVRGIEKVEQTQLASQPSVIAQQGLLLVSYPHDRFVVGSVAVSKSDLAKGVTKISALSASNWGF
jgi:hypothetical protein